MIFQENFLTFTMREHQSQHKQGRDGGRIEMTIHNVQTIFQIKTGNAIKIFNAGGLKMTRGVPRK